MKPAKISEDRNKAKSLQSKLTREPVIITIILLFAFSLRLISLNQIKANPFFYSPILDSLYYDNWAKEILKTGWIGKGVSYGNPLYAYFLAVIYMIFGRDFFIVRVIQYMIGSFSCIFIYLIGRKVFNKSIGIISAVIASGYGIFIFYEGELGLDSLALFFATASILLLMRAKDRPSAGNWFFAGLVGGLFMLTRANILPLVVLIWLAVTFKDKIKKTAFYYLIFFLGMIFVISPITIRNHLASGELVFITAHGGETFYVGNNPNADGTCKQPDFVMPNTMEEHEDYRRMASNILGRRLSLSESSSYWFEQAIKFIRENPGEYLTLLLKKMMLFCQATELSDNQQFYFFRDYSALLRIPFERFGFLFPLSLMGMAVCIRNWRKAFLIYLFAVMYSFSIIAYFITSRYRMLAVPFFIIFAAYYLYWLTEKIKKKEYGILAVTLVIFVGMLFVVNKGINRQSGMDTGHYNLGKIYEDNGKYDKAIEEYNKAIELNPYHYRTYLNLGNIYYKMGRIDEAIVHYKKALSFNPNDYKAWNNLGTISIQKGLYEEAIKNYKRAIEIKPDYVFCLNNLGELYFNLGDNESALHYLHCSLEIEPTQPRITALAKEIEQRRNRQ